MNHLKEKRYKLLLGEYHTNLSQAIDSGTRKARFLPISVILGEEELLYKNDSGAANFEKNPA